MTRTANRQMEAHCVTRMRIRAPREINGPATGEFPRSYCEDTGIATIPNEQLAYHGVPANSLAIRKPACADLRKPACFRHRTSTCSGEYTRQWVRFPSWLPHLKPTP